MTVVDSDRVTNRGSRYNISFLLTRLQTNQLKRGRTFRRKDPDFYRRLRITVVRTSSSDNESS